MLAQPFPKPNTKLSHRLTECRWKFNSVGQSNGENQPRPFGKENCMNKDLNLLRCYEYSAF